MPRIKSFHIIVSSSFLFLIFALGYTQIIKGPYYYELSQKNRIRLVPVPAPRGIIYDRNSKILVDNKISFDCVVTPEEIVDKNKTFKRLGQILGIKEKDLHQGFKDGYIAPFIPVTLARDIPKDKAFILEELKTELPGVEICMRPLRDYVYDKIAAHILGYLGEIDEPTLSKWKEYGYKAKDLIGRSGVEMSFDDYLRGKDGGIQIEVDNRGHSRAILGYRQPQKGNDLQLTVDIGMQRILDDLLSKIDKKGAIIVIDPHTGEILSLSSFPCFNPNMFIKPSSHKVNLNSLLQDPSSPMLNRCVAGQYPPGSIFKVIVAIAGLENKRIKPETNFSCGGSLLIGGREFHCWKKEGHGQQDIRSALAYSCNIFFYRLGLKLGVNTLCEYATKFGLGELTRIELPGEAEGFLPGKTLRTLSRQQRWYDGETANLSIGQGQVLVSPIQVARMISVIANQGNLVQPHLAKSDDMSFSKRLSISKQAISITKRGLVQAIENESGTGSAARIPDLTIAGKTGTAQGERAKSYGWFVGFCPVKKPKIAFAILLEEGNGELASKIARMMLEEMLAEKLL